MTLKPVMTRKPEQDASGALTGSRDDPVKTKFCKMPYFGIELMSQDSRDGVITTKQQFLVMSRMSFHWGGPGWAGGGT